GRIRRTPRARLRRRAEPRRPALRPDSPGPSPGAGRPPALDSALQRAAHPRRRNLRTTSAAGGCTRMSTTLNRVGLHRDAYKGAATTLCAGCGHNSITNHMIKALYELGVEPHL